MLILQKQEGHSPGASTILRPETEQPNHFVNSIDAKKADKIPTPKSKNKYQTSPMKLKILAEQDKGYLLKTRAKHKILCTTYSSCSYIEFVFCN